jgi:hypothetical protein
VNKTPDRRGPEQSKVKLQICNNCGYNCEYPNKSQSNPGPTIFNVAENLTRDIIIVPVVIIVAYLVHA